MNNARLLLFWSLLFLASFGLAQTSQVAGAKAASAATTNSFVVQVTGRGKPMLLIPGLSCGGDVWKTTVDHFKDRYECHVFTLAGFAGQPAIAPPMLETIRKDMAAYIRGKKLEHPVIMGHSLGGFLAFWLGATEPELVGPIVSVDGGTFLAAMFDPKATLETAKSGGDLMRAMLGNQTPEQFAEQNREFLATMITDPKNVDLIAPTCAKSDPKAVGQAMYELMTTDLRKEVAAIRTPVLLIGSGSLITSPERKKGVQDQYEAQVANIPNHKVLIADKAKHFIMFDDAPFLFSAMEDFLKAK